MRLIYLALQLIFKAFIVFHSTWLVPLWMYSLSIFTLHSVPRSCTLELHPLGHNTPRFQLSLANGRHQQQIRSRWREKLGYFSDGFLPQWAIICQRLCPSTAGYSCSSTTSVVNKVRTTSSLGFFPCLL